MDNSCKQILGLISARGREHTTHDRIRIGKQEYNVGNGIEAHRK